MKNIIQKKGLPYYCVSRLLLPVISIVLMVVYFVMYHALPTPVHKIQEPWVYALLLLTGLLLAGVLQRFAILEGYWYIEDVEDSGLQAEEKILKGKALEIAATAKMLRKLQDCKQFMKTRGDGRALSDLQEPSEYWENLYDRQRAEYHQLRDAFVNRLQAAHHKDLLPPLIPEREKVLVEAG